VNSPLYAEEKSWPTCEMLRWKEGGLKGPFFAVNCRSVRIGSYRFTPVGRVLFSSEGIMLQAPVFHTFNQPSGNSGTWINVVIPAQQLLQVDANFYRQLPVIFLDATPNICRSVCKELGLLKSAGPYWDYLSDEESKKHLTLWPSNLDDSAKNAIKRAFVPKGVFREITHIEANRRLVISLPREVRDAIAKLTIFHTDSSKDSSKQSGKLPTTSYWCHMKGTLKEIDFEWKIDRLAFFNDVGLWESLTSTEFGQHKFRLSLVVDGSNLQIKLLCSTSFVNPRRVEVAILNDNGKKNFQNTVGIAAVERFPVKVFEISKNAFLESGNFVCGEITIYCKISTFIREELTGESTATNSYLCKTPTGDHSEDLQKREELFATMDLSDVVFNVCGRQFTAHKIILAMKSPVFKAMFHHSSNKEVLSGQVKVEDIEPDVFQEILLFIYTGRTQLTAMNKMAPGILAAADKYLLQDLKTRCETHLIRQMSAENCLELLSLTTHHPAEHLKKYANEYFRRFPGKIHVEK
jgi:speckle-type POZ protein